jgi:hypothetical protein
MANKHHHEQSGRFLRTDDVRGFRVHPTPAAPPPGQAQAAPVLPFVIPEQPKR